MVRGGFQRLTVVEGNYMTKAEVRSLTIINDLEPSLLAPLLREPNQVFFQFRYCNNDSSFATLQFFPRLNWNVPQQLLKLARQPGKKAVGAVQLVYKTIPMYVAFGVEHLHSASCWIYIACCERFKDIRDASANPPRELRKSLAKKNVFVDKASTIRVVGSIEESERFEQRIGWFFVVTVACSSLGVE
jgi:hypothetical protein